LLIQLRRLTTISACLLALAACGSTDNIPADAAKTLVLTKSDLPGAFAVFAEGPTARLDTQGTPRADLQRFGRKSGWVARFNRAGSAQTNGPLVAVSTVDVFGGEDGAKADLGAFRRQFGEETARRAAGTRLVRVPALGDDVAAVTSLQAGSPAVRFFTIAWRERNALASVTASGFANRFELADVLRLARRQQQKLAARGG
jgi:hypothetical protein